MLVPNPKDQNRRSFSGELSFGCNGEIEEAVNQIKQATRRGETDDWFRNQWYRCLAIGLKCRQQHNEEKLQERVSSLDSEEI